MQILSEHNFSYDLRKITVNIHHTSLEFYVLENLDQTIDKLCNSLEQKQLQNTQGKIDPLSEDYCPYFGVLWPSSKGLCQFILGHKELFKDKSVLEIGCGLALPSFFLKTQFSSQETRIVASDFHRDVPLFLKENFHLNNLEFSYLPMNWRSPPDTFEKFDIVMGSDILYEGRHPYEVCHALIHFLKPGGTILLSDPGRTYIQKFVSAMNELGFKDELFPESVELDGEKREIFVFSFKFC